MQRVAFPHYRYTHEDIFTPHKLRKKALEIADQEARLQALLEGRLEGRLEGAEGLQGRDLMWHVLGSRGAGGEGRTSSLADIGLDGLVELWSHGTGLIITPHKSLKSYKLFEMRHHMYHHNVSWINYGMRCITHKHVGRVTKSGLSQTKVGMCSWNGQPVIPGGASGGAVGCVRRFGGWRGRPGASGARGGREYGSGRGRAPSGTPSRTSSNSASSGGGGALRTSCCASSCASSSYAP